MLSSRWHLKLCTCAVGNFSAFLKLSHRRLEASSKILHKSGDAQKKHKSITGKIQVYSSCSKSMACADICWPAGGQDELGSLETSVAFVTRAAGPFNLWACLPLPNRPLHHNKTIMRREKQNVYRTHFPAFSFNQTMSELRLRCLNYTFPCLYLHILRCVY